MTISDISKPNVKKQHVVDHHSVLYDADITDINRMIELQVRSYERFEQQGLKELLDMTFPIEDTVNNRFVMLYGNQGLDEPATDEPEYLLDDPLYDEEQCLENGLTYNSRLRVRIRLVVKARGDEEEEQWMFLGHIPKMTSRGTFIINGSERVVVSQIVRSPGAYFGSSVDNYTGSVLPELKIIPDRGVWIEAETTTSGIIYVKLDHKRKVAMTTLMHALGVKPADVRAGLEGLGGYADNIIAAMNKETVSSRRDALQEVYKRLRPNEPFIVDDKNAKELVLKTFFDRRQYTLGEVGRFKINKRLGLNEEGLVLTPNDFIACVRKMVEIGQGSHDVDDIDHLGNRRVRAVGELVQRYIRAGMLRIEQTIKDRMATSYFSTDGAYISPAAFINNRPFITAAKNFFTSSQLSQFTDQTNPLSELTHKRRISSMGAGGLTRTRASFDVRDVHYSHYGRLCPIETPEGPNIGLLNSLATFAEVDRHGFIQTMYWRVLNTMSSDNPDLEGRTVTEAVTDKSGKTIVEAGKVVSAAQAEEIRKLKKQDIVVKSYVSYDEKRDLIHLTADLDQNYKIAQSGVQLDAKNQIEGTAIEIRQGENFMMAPVEEVDLVDYSTRQMVSVSTALIPFLEYDDANRALMGSNMQRQSVPLVEPRAPLVGTGIEKHIARNSGDVIVAPADGVVIASSSAQVVMVDETEKTHTYNLDKFKRSNQGTCINQTPIVKAGDIVKKGQAIVDSHASENGELALGQNVMIGFMSWEGYNYEDAIVISEDLVKNDTFTSVHIEKYEVDCRKTPLGPEEFTRDIPSVGEERLRNVDEDGIVRLGAWVEAGDILVGKISPQGETELTSEEKLLRALFGEKAQNVKDMSLRMPNGQEGYVIKVRELEVSKLREQVLRTIRVWVARTRKIGVGDKMAGRHGNKGVIARILPREDMPYLPNGRPLDMLLNPIGVPSRMNLGQLMETHLGFAADILNEQYRYAVFESMSQEEVEDHLARAWLVEKSEAYNVKNIDEYEIDEAKLKEWLVERGYDFNAIWASKSRQRRGHARLACMRIWLQENSDVEGVKNMKASTLASKVREVEQERGISNPLSGKFTLRDGRTGEEFLQPVTVGYMYMLKLNHLAKDKVHARSTGPYSLITQQPLGGKAQFGGQRFGEMEVWALQAYSAAYTLQEMLSIKSDDVGGRYKAYDDLTKGRFPMSAGGKSESFNVLVKEMQSLGLQLELINKDDEQLALTEGAEEFATGDYSEGTSMDFDISNIGDVDMMTDYMNPDEGEE